MLRCCAGMTSLPGFRYVVWMPTPGPTASQFQLAPPANVRGLSVVDMFTGADHVRPSSVLDDTHTWRSSHEFTVPLSAGWWFMNSQILLVDRSATAEACGAVRRTAMGNSRARSRLVFTGESLP